MKNYIRKIKEYEEGGRVMEKDIYGIEACRKSIKCSVEECGDDPIRLLGEYHLRAKQDVFFNKTMIKALEQYIEENGIKWDD